MSTMTHQRPAVTLDITAMPVLNKTAEAARAELVRYADAMGALGKPLSQIRLRPSAFQSIVQAIDQARRKLNPDAPPCGGLTFRGAPVLPWAPAGKEVDDAAA